MNITTIFEDYQKNFKDLLLKDNPQLGATLIDQKILKQHIQTLKLSYVTDLNLEGLDPSDQEAIRILREKIVKNYELLLEPAIIQQDDIKLGEIASALAYFNAILTTINRHSKTINEDFSGVSAAGFTPYQFNMPPQYEVDQIDSTSQQNLASSNDTSLQPAMYYNPELMNSLGNIIPQSNNQLPQSQVEPLIFASGLDERKSIGLQIKQNIEKRNQESIEKLEKMAKEGINEGLSDFEVTRDLIETLNNYLQAKCEKLEEKFKESSDKFKNDKEKIEYICNEFSKIINEMLGHVNSIESQIDPVLLGESQGYLKRFSEKISQKLNLYNISRKPDKKSKDVSVKFFNLVRNDYFDIAQYIHSLQMDLANEVKDAAVVPPETLSFNKQVSNRFKTIKDLSKDLSTGIKDAFIGTEHQRLLRKKEKERKKFLRDDAMYNHCHQMTINELLSLIKEKGGEFKAPKYIVNIAIRKQKEYEANPEEYMRKEKIMVYNRELAKQEAIEEAEKRYYAAEYRYHHEIHPRDFKGDMKAYRKALKELEKILENPPGSIARRQMDRYNARELQRDIATSIKRGHY